MKLKASSEFKLVENADDAKAMLIEAERTIVSAFFWVKGNDTLYKTHFSSFNQNDQTFSCQLPQSPGPEEFKKALASSGASTCLFSLSLASANTFFEATLLRQDDKGLKFSVPKKIFTVQRRQFMRHTFQPSERHQVEYSNPSERSIRSKKRLYDISGGGFSMLIAATEKDVYPDGIPLKEITLIVRERVIHAQGEIRHKKPNWRVDGEPALRVGVRFTSISQADTDFIAAFVFEEARKTFQNFVE